MQTFKYQTKPDVVEAVQVTDANMGEVTLWVKGELYEDDPEYTGLMRHIQLRGSDGVVYAAYRGMYVIKNADESFNVMVARDFFEKYEQKPPRSTRG